jgi:hypothetical protein
MHSDAWRNTFGTLALIGSLALALALTGCKTDTSNTPGSGAAAATSVAISGTPAASVNAGQAYAFQPTVNASAGSTVSFSVQNKPAWATLNTATGQLSGTPAAADAGIYANIVISASNGTASAALAPFQISVVKPVAGTATVLWMPPTQNQDGTPLTNLAGFHIYYGNDPSTLAQMTVVTNPTLSSYQLANLAAGTWYFAVAAYTSDGVESALSDVVSKTI